MTKEQVTTEVSFHPERTKVSRREFIKWVVTAGLSGVLWTLFPTLFKSRRASAQAASGDGGPPTSAAQAETAPAVAPNLIATNVPGTNLFFSEHAENNLGVTAAATENAELQTLNTELAEFFKKPYFIDLWQRATPELQAAAETPSPVTVEKKAGEESVYLVSYLRAGETKQFAVTATYYTASDYKVLQRWYGTQDGGEKVVKLTFQADLWEDDASRYQWNMYFLAEGNVQSDVWEDVALTETTNDTNRQNWQRLDIEKLLQKIGFGLDPENLRTGLFDSAFDIANQSSAAHFPAVDHFISRRISGFAHSLLPNSGTPENNPGSTDSFYDTVTGPDYMRRVFVHELVHASLSILQIFVDKQMDESMAHVGHALAADRDGDAETFSHLFSFSQFFEGSWNGIKLHTYEPGQLAVLFAHLGKLLNISDDEIAGLRGEKRADHLPTPDAMLVAFRSYMSLALQLRTVINRAYAEMKPGRETAIININSFDTHVQFHAPLQWREYLQTRNIPLDAVAKLSIPELDIEGFLAQLQKQGYENNQTLFHDIFMRLWTDPQNCSPHEMIARTQIIANAQEQIQSQLSSVSGSNVALNQDYRSVTFQRNEATAEKIAFSPVEFSLGDFYDLNFHGWDVPVVGPVVNLASLPEECFAATGEKSVFITNNSGADLWIMSPYSEYVQKINPGQEVELRVDLMAGMTDNPLQWNGYCMLVGDIYNDPAYHHFFQMSQLPEQAILDKKIQLCSFRMDKKVAVPIQNATYLPLIDLNSQPVSE